MEVAEHERTRSKQTTGADGAFHCHKVREGRYIFRARSNAFVLVEETVSIAAGARNFAAILLPKRRAGGQNFGTVSVNQLAC